MAARKRKRKTRKRGVPSKPPKFVAFEKAVARVQKMLDPDSAVTHNEHIVGRDGLKRQFDVIVRGKAAGHDLLVVIECRDHNRKKGASDVEALAAKAEDICANIRIIVSRLGFTEQGLQRAKFLNVTPLSLLPNASDATLPSMFIIWYARIHEWHDIHLLAEFLGTGPRFEWSGTEMLHNGACVANFFVSQLRDYSDSPDGVLTIDTKFVEPFAVTIKGALFQLVRVQLDATRKTRKARGKLLISGDGFFDWASDKPLIPRSGRFTVHNFDPNCADWEAYEGEFPALDPQQAIVDRCFNALPDNAPLPNLEQFIRPPTITFKPA